MLKLTNKNNRGNTVDKIVRCLLVVGALFALSSCATVGNNSVSYIEPPSDGLPNNTEVIDQPFNAVWDKLVGELSSSFFVINNIDKESRLINISFISKEPEKYIDCGVTKRRFSFGKENRDYSYKVSESSSYKYAGKWGVYQNLPSIFDIHRNTSLEGRINIYVAPVSGDKTKVSVNIRYILTSKVTGTATGYNAFGQFVRKDTLPPSSHTCSFNTKEVSHENWGTDDNPAYVTCVSAGTLERKLLKMAQ